MAEGVLPKAEDKWKKQVKFNEEMKDFQVNFNIKFDELRTQLASIYELFKESQKIKSQEESGAGTSYVQQSGHKTTEFELSHQLKNSNRYDSLKIPKIDFPIFYGVQPREWVRDCEQYFIIHAVSDDLKLRLGELHLRGEAELWLIGWKLNNSSMSMSWEFLKDEVCNRFEVKPMEAVVDEFHPLNQSNCNPGYETLEDSEMLDLHEIISCESAIKHSIVEENEQDEENDDNGGGMLPFVYVQLIFGTGCESTVIGSPKAWFEEVTSGLKVVLGQNAIGDEAHKVFDEMSQSFRAVLLDKPATMSHGHRFRSLSASVIDEVEVARIYSSNIVMHSSLTVLITYLNNLTYQPLVECKNAILFSDMETFLFDPGGWSLPQTDCDPFGFIGEQGDFYLATNVVEIMGALITHKDMIKNASICGVIVQNHGTDGDISEYEGFIRHVKASFSPVDSPDTVVGIGMWQTDNCVNDCFVNHLCVAHALNEGSAFSGSKGVLVPTCISTLGNSLLALYHNMDNPSGAIMILGHFKILEGVMVHLFLFTHPKDVQFTSLIIRIGWEVAREEVERAFTWESNKEDGGFNTRKKFSHAKVQPVKWDESFKHCIFLTWEQMQELFGELYLRVQQIDANFENRSANASMICHIGRCNNILFLADNVVMLSFDPSGCSCLVSSWDGEDHFPPNWGGSFDNGQKIEVLSISFVSMWMYGVNFDKIPGGLISWSLKSHFIFNFTESLDDPCWKILTIKVDDALVKAKEHCAKTFGEQLETNGPSLRSGSSFEACKNIEDNSLNVVVIFSSRGSCVTYLRNGCYSHLVEMAHNRTEYGVVQLIKRDYDQLHTKTYHLEMDHTWSMLTMGITVGKGREMARDLGEESEYITQGFNSLSSQNKLNSKNLLRPDDVECVFACISVEKIRMISIEPGELKNVISLNYGGMRFSFDPGGDFDPLRTCHLGNLARVREHNKDFPKYLFAVLELKNHSRSHQKSFSVQPTVVLIGVEVTHDFVINLDETTLSTYQYYGNMGNFLVAEEGIGFLTFKAGDLEHAALIVQKAMKIKVIADAILVIDWCIEIGDELATEKITIAGDDWKLQMEQGWSILQNVVCNEDALLRGVPYDDDGLKILEYFSVAAMTLLLATHLENFVWNPGLYMPQTFCFILEDKDVLKGRDLSGPELFEFNYVFLFIF